MKLTIIPSLLFIGALAVGCSSNDDRSTADASPPSTTTAATTAPSEPTMATETPADEMDAGTTTADNKTEMAGSATPELTNSSSNTTTSTTTTATRTIASEGQEGEVMAMLSAFDNHEIETSTEAQTKASSQEVKDYATMMVSEHRTSMQKTQSVANSMNLTSMSTPKVDEFKAKNAEAMASLSDKSGVDYDKAYMDMMVKDHQEALKMIDTQLMPMTKSDEMKTHLTEVRKHISDHLDKAEDIQEEL